MLSYERNCWKFEHVLRNSIGNEVRSIYNDKYFEMWTSSTIQVSQLPCSQGLVLLELCNTCVTWWNVPESSMVCKSAWLSSVEISKSLCLQQKLSITMRSAFKWLFFQPRPFLQSLLLFFQPYLFSSISLLNHHQISWISKLASENLRMLNLTVRRLKWGHANAHHHSNHWTNFLLLHKWNCIPLLTVFTFI